MGSKSGIDGVLDVAIVSGGATAVDPAEGANGAAAPAFAMQIGGVDTAGRLQTLTAAVLHTTDNQSFGSASRGILTGGVAQLVNAAGSVDRQRETGFDNAPAQGIAAGAQQLASPPLLATLTQAVSAGINPQSVSVSAVSFNNRGVVQSLQAGSLVLVGGVNPEFVYLTSVGPGPTLSGVFTLNHASGDPVTSFSYSQQRDSTIPDGSSPAGIAAGMEYLFNAPGNSVEAARSFAGELNGATGAGSAIAVEYMDTAGGPLTAAGKPTGLRLQAGLNLTGKGRATQAITATLAGQTNLTFASASQTNTLLAGAAVQLSGSGAAETVYVSTTWTPGASPNVPLQNAVVNAAQTTAAWDSYQPNGPGLSGFLPHGVAVEEEAIFDPVSGLYFIERAATQDGANGQNLVLESPALFNGAGFDRARSPAGDAQTATGIQAVTPMGWNGATYDRLTVDPSKRLKVLVDSITAGAAVQLRAAASASGILVSRLPSNSAAAFGSVKAAAGQVFGYDLLNTSAAVRFVHLYNKTSQPTLGADTPIYSIGLPAGARVALTSDIALGVFAAGIEWQITTDAATIPTTAATAGDVVGVVIYA